MDQTRRYVSDLDLLREENGLLHLTEKAMLYLIEFERRNENKGDGPGKTNGPHEQAV